MYGTGQPMPRERVIVALRRIGHGGFFLNVLRKDHAGDGVLIHRDAEGAIDAVPHGRRAGHGDAIFAGDILEERLQIDFLLILAADRGRRGLADDGDDRLVIHLGVVEAVEQVDRAGAAGGHADADRAGEFRVAQAMNAASSSCRAWMKRGLSPFFRRPARRPLMPSPG